MARAERCRTVDWNWDEFADDARVQAMTPEQLGLWIRCLRALACAETPGHLMGGEDTLQRVTGANDREWRRSGQAVIAALERTGGGWRHARTERDHYRQTASIAASRDQKRAAGRRSASQRRDQRLPNGRWSAAPTEPPTGDQPPSLLHSFTPEKQTDSAIPASSPAVLELVNGNGQSEADELTWAQIFDSWFWPQYPRKVGKPGALRAWKAIRPQSQVTADAMAEGLERWRQSWTEPRFIPHPATFLNQRRWEDQP